MLAVRIATNLCQSKLSTIWSYNPISCPMSELLARSHTSVHSFSDLWISAWKTKLIWFRARSQAPNSEEVIGELATSLVMHDFITGIIRETYPQYGQRNSRNTMIVYSRKIFVTYYINRMF